MSSRWMFLFCIMACYITSYHMILYHTILYHTILYYIKFHELLGFRIFLRNSGNQGQDAIFGAVYAHKGRTKKNQRHGLHGFGLDQPSMSGIGLINRSEKWKRSETIGNGRKQAETWSGQKLVQQKISISAQGRFFLKVQRCPKVPKGKQLETIGDRTFARQKSCCFVEYVHETWLKIM